MTSAPDSRMPAFLRGYPGAVLEVSPSGEVLASNGRLEGALGRPLVGRRLVEALDRSSSQAKWERIRAGEGCDGETVWELVLHRRGSLGDPRAFSAIRDPETESLWLMEHPRDPRMDGLSREVVEVNSELSLAQRSLSKERARLAQALEALEARQRELEARNRELDQFAFVVSHDLRAPLRSIAAYAGWLEQDLEGKLEGETLEYLERLRGRVDHLEAMIQGILQLSRAGRSGTPPEEVDVGALVGEVVELLGPPAEVRIEIDPGMPTIVTERLQLEQVFLNLVGNALKYAGGPGARVRVSARDAGDLVEFSVADDGPGVPARLQDRLWTIFFTGRPDDEAGATGIGLAIVKKLVENHGGSVRLESEPGAGATFSFLWPRAPRADA